MRPGNRNFLRKLFSPGRLSCSERSSHLPVNFDSFGFEAVAPRFSGFFLLLGHVLERARGSVCSGGDLRFGLISVGLQLRRCFLRLPTGGLESVRGGFELLCVFALCENFPREPLR